MSEKTEPRRPSDETADERDESQAPEGTEESDTEGHSMFLYEGARNMSRQHEREAQEAGRQAKLLKELKEEKRR